MGEAFSGVVDGVDVRRDRGVKRQANQPTAITMSKASMSANMRRVPVRFKSGPAV